MTAFAVFFFVPAELFAFQISPSIQILNLKHGEKATCEYTLTNTDEVDMNLYTEAKDWFLLPGNENFKAEGWLTFGATYYPFKFGQTITVKMDIKVPKGAKGELVGGASFIMDEGKGGNIVKKMTSVVYVAIKGTENFGVDLIGFQFDPSTAALKAGVFLENKGNIHVRPEGWVSVSDSKGNPIANIHIDRSAPLFPGNKWSYYGSVPGANLLAGDYVAKISLTDGDRGKDVVQGEKKFRLKKDGKVELITK